MFLSGFGPRPVSGNVDEIGVEPAHMQGRFESLAYPCLLEGLI